ncbi:hypothetical protein TNCT1_68120 [Streptomyces sp. 1-11]|nr:hypothetical protein TNCT1_68120 [Streptomyces sp. 1-11]
MRSEARGAATSGAAVKKGTAVKARGVSRVVQEAAGDEQGGEGAGQGTRAGAAAPLGRAGRAAGAGVRVRGGTTGGPAPRPGARLVLHLTRAHCWSPVSSTYDQRGGAVGGGRLLWPERMTCCDVRHSTREAAFPAPGREHGGKHPGPGSMYWIPALGLQ